MYGVGSGAALEEICEEEGSRGKEEMSRSWWHGSGENGE